MMLKPFFVVIAVAAVAADLDSDWAVFKAKYNKIYTQEVEYNSRKGQGGYVMSKVLYRDTLERWDSDHSKPLQFQCSTDLKSEIELVRQEIWMENRQIIEEHNKKFRDGLSSFYLGENEYADMTNEEINSKMNGFKSYSESHAEKHPEIDVASLPDTVDWRTKGYVTEVKNQKYCGSCWAFSATGALEGQHFNATGKLINLSESNLIDCSRPYGNNGCNGGSPNKAFEYVIDNKGVNSDASYPYTDNENECKFKSSDEVAAAISKYQTIQMGSEYALQRAVAEVGPISVAIDARHNSFQNYMGGVYNEPKCSSTKLTHAVLVVGYGTYQGKDYWLVKNSWGTSWGMEGYIMMSRNRHNQCGIATAASYPMV